MSSGVSIVITSYNVESYIERAIHSALSQMDVLAEVIVVDDCSTDNTWEVISAISDPRLKCIRLSQNGGPSVARNTGFDLATHPWIAILDGDDVFVPDRLSRAIKHAEASKADIVVDNILVLNEVSGTKFPMFNPTWLSKRKNLDLTTFISENRMFQGGYTLGYLKPIFSRDFLRKHHIAYDDGLRIGEDYMILAEALANGAVCSIESTPGYQYTIRKGSISHRLSLENILRIMEGDTKFLSRYKLDPVAAKAQIRRSKSLQEALAYTKLVNGIKQRNIHDVVDALKLSPKATFLLWEPVWVRVKRLFKSGRRKNP